jgi:hypothetical protein
MLRDLGVDLDPHGNVKADTNRYATSVSKVFTAGDMRRGQSLVVCGPSAKAGRRARGGRVPYGGEYAAPVRKPGPVGWAKAATAF